MADYQATPQPAADPAIPSARRAHLGHHSLYVDHRARAEHRGLYPVAPCRLPEWQSARRHHRRRRVARARIHTPADHGTDQRHLPDELISRQLPHVRCWHDDGITAGASRAHPVSRHQLARVRASADRGALVALRAIPGFDSVLKTLSGAIGERSIGGSTSPLRSASRRASIRTSSRCWTNARPRWTYSLFRSCTSSRIPLLRPWRSAWTRRSS